MSSGEGSTRRCSNLRNCEERAEETLEDRISQLPDALLVQILSLLPLTQYAITTCILSKRWRFLCYSIFNFHFDYTTFSRTQHFISFVDHVLTHSTCSKIKNFHLHVTVLPEWHFKISQWLCFAVENKVEHLLLLSNDTEDLEYYKLPLSISTCSSLISLNLTCWWFDKDYVIAWNSLNCLKLQAVWLDDDDVVKLLSGCPALETLQLLVCEDIRCFTITSSNLKTLKLSAYYFDKDDASLEIIAPHLHHLELTGNVEYWLVNVSSLVTATLTFTISCINNVLDEDAVEEAESCRQFHQVSRNLVLDYLQKLSYVTELRIGRWFAKVLFMLQLEGVPLPELRWKCLTLEMHTKYIMCVVASLLRTSPSLETLHMDIGDWFHDEHCPLEVSYLGKVDTINLQSWLSNIVFPNLKTVKIVCSIIRCVKGQFEGDNDKLLELSEFLLKNALALKTFVIVSKKRGICSRCSESCVSGYLSQLAKILSDSSRSSRNLKITYQESGWRD